MFDGGWPARRAYAVSSCLVTVILAASDAFGDAPAASTAPASHRQTAEMMQMDDDALYGQILINQLEWREGGGGNTHAAWDAQGWYGGDYNRLMVRTEGLYVSGGSDGTGDSESGVTDASAELLWSRVVSRWWNLEVGARQDFGPGQARTWAAFGIQGIAPQWFDTEATVYASDEGRTALRLKTQYDLLLTQRLVLQPYVEANLYGRSEPGLLIGSGLSEMAVSLRLRYELRRELAPYVGVVWQHRFGATADLARAAGEDSGDWQFVAGLYAWL